MNEQASLAIGDQISLSLPVECEKGTVAEALLAIAERAPKMNTKQVGDWFEAVVLRLLKVDPSFEMDDAWLRQDCPRGLGIDLRADRGTDIIAQTKDGRMVAVQCKYRSQGLLTKGDINSFLADAATKQQYDMLWIIANVEFGGNAAKTLAGMAKPCQYINVTRNHLGIQLDPAHEKVLRQPRPLQRQAIEAVQRRLGPDGDTDRGKLIMACGTGKTFTALRIAEGLCVGKPNAKLLFAAPSIALAGQARREWLTHAAADLSTLVVCSSQAEGKAPVRREGALHEPPHALTCEVTTQPERIAEFLRGTGRRAVFCTYQSLHRVVEAQRLGGVGPFALAIADEAHRTTGKFDKTKKGDLSWGLFLKDALLAAKRLYMTATPRVYTKASKEGVPFEVVDMADACYGPTLHRLSFHDAVKAGMLCDYRVIVLALQNGLELTPAVLEAFKAAQDEVGDAKLEVSVADQIRLFGISLAVNGAIEGADVETPDSLPRTLVFANKCNKSEWVAKAIRRGETQRLTGLRLPERLRKDPSRKRGKRDGFARKVNAVHLDAKTPGGKRLAEVTALRDTSNAECSMICNVGLFGEGVDIPALDAVAFFEARRSAIDIMQAVGRVMRKADGKKLGYVIVPVVVPPGDDVIKALRDSKDGFERVGEVLRALQSHHPSLADCLSDYVHIVQPAPPDPPNGNGSGGGGGPPPQEEFRFDLSRAATDGALYAHIGDAAGFRSRKDLVADHMKAKVEAVAQQLLELEFAVPLAQALGLPHAPLPENATRDAVDERGNAATIAALLLINALLLSHRLAGHLPDVPAECITRLAGLPNPYGALRRAWLNILRKDYAPIVRPALALLDVLGSNSRSSMVLRILVDAAMEVAAEISDFSYDHSGPLFHKVLGKRGEADGAFYSNNLAALLLAGLAIPKDPGRTLRVLDPACGTGTLLLAALDTLKRHALRENPGLDPAELHRKLVEESIHGLDINHHAAQFAAANLTLGAPDVGFAKMNLAAVREGVQDGVAYAGSLELLPRQQLSLDLRVQDIAAPLPPIEGLPDAQGAGDFNPGDMDVVITNPPFTEVNKRKKKLSSDRDRDRMSQRFDALKAGLDDDAATVLKGARAIGPFFIPLTHHLLRKDGGTLAMVRPVSAMTSPSASGLAERQYLAKYFHLAVTVTSHASKNSAGLGINFSHDTDVHEALLVLRRWPDGKPRPPTKAVSLHRQPANRTEALALLDGIQTGKGMEEWGNVAEWPAERVTDGDWSYANWHDAGLAEWALKVRALKGLDDLGRHVRLIGRNPNFSKACEKTADADCDLPLYDTVGEGDTCTMNQSAAAGAKFKADADDDVLKAVNRPLRAFVAFRTRPGVARLWSLYAPKPSISTAFHGLLAHTTDSRYEPALVAFLNSTFGWLQILNQRAFTLDYTRNDPVGVRRIQVPQPDNPAIPSLARVFDALKDKDFSQGRDSADCPVRAQLDGAVARAIGFDENVLHDLRRRIGAEPTVAQGMDS